MRLTAGFTSTAAALLYSTVALAGPTTAPTTAKAKSSTTAELDGILAVLVSKTPNFAGVDKAMARLSVLGLDADPLVPALLKEIELAGKIRADDMQGRYIEALGAIGTPSVVEPLVTLVMRSITHSPAINAIVSAGEPAIAPLEAAALIKPERDRMDILGALHKIGGPNALAALDRLKTKLTLKSNIGVADAMATDLRYFSAAELLPALRAKKNVSLYALTQTGFTGLDSALTLLGDTDPALRTQGAFAVQLMTGEFEKSRRQRQLPFYVNAHRADIKRALADPNTEVQKTARTLAKNLGVNTAESAAALVAAATTPKAKIEALQLLIKDAGPKAEPVLMKVINTDPDRATQRQAAKMLLRLPPADRRLESALRGDNFILRIEAIEAALNLKQAGWRTLFRVMSDMNHAHRLRITPPGNGDGYAVALEALDGDDPKLVLPATTVIASVYSFNVQLPTPSPKAIGRIVAMLADADPQRSGPARQAMMRMAMVATVPVIPLLKSPDANVRLAAATTLAGDPGQPALRNRLPELAVDPLLAAAADADPRVREQVAIALGRLVEVYRPPKLRQEGPIKLDDPPQLREPVVKKLQAMWGDPDAEVRAAAVLALVQNPGGFTNLQLARKHADQTVVDLAEFLSRQRDESPPRPVNDLLRVLNDPRQSSVTQAFVTLELAGHGSSGAAAITPLATQLKSAKNVRVRWASAQALGAVGGGSPDAAAALIAALDDPDPGVVVYSLRSIRKVGPVAAAAAPRVAKFLDDTKGPDVDSQQASLRTAAFDALSGLGAAAMPALLPVLEDGDRGEQYAATQSLQRIGPAAAPAVPLLVKAIENTSAAPMTTNYVKTLTAIGPAAAKLAVPTLTGLLKTPDFTLRSAVVESLGAMGPAAATPEIIAFLTTPNRSGAQDPDASRALGAMGPAAISAAPTLIKQVQKTLDQRKTETPRVGGGSMTSFGNVELQAVRALGKMGPAANAALPVIQESLDTVTKNGDRWGIAVVNEAQARITGKQPLGTPDYTEPAEPPRGPREVGPSESFPPVDLGGPFVNPMEPRSP